MNTLLNHLFTIFVVVVVVAIFCESVNRMEKKNTSFQWVAVERERNNSY